MIFIEKNSEQYYLPDDCWCKSLNFDIRTKDETRAYSHGRIETGDGKVDSRTLDVEMIVDAANNYEHDYLLGEINRQLAQRDYKLFLRADRYINVKTLDKVKHEYYPGFSGRRSKLTYTLKCVDPFFYSTVESVTTVSLSSNPQTFTVDNPSNVDCPAVMAFTAAGNLFDLIVTNTTDAGKQFAVTDTLLSSGVTLTVNSVNGTVYRGEDNAINAFAGLFPRLIAGSNSFSYAGAAATLEIRFTPRWL